MLTRPNREQGETDHIWPVFLPGGQVVLFTITAGAPRDAAVAGLDLRTENTSASYRAVVTPLRVRGHLVYGAGGTLRAVGAFYLDRLEVVGTPFLVLPQMVTRTRRGRFRRRLDGTLVTFRPASRRRPTLVWVDRQAPKNPSGRPRARISTSGSRRWQARRARHPRPAERHLALGTRGP